jgi:heat shock protein HslJ
MSRTLACFTLVFGTLAAGCGSPAEKPAAPPESAASAPEAEGAAPAAASLPAALAGTEWRLVEFQSMDDAQGTERPSDPALCTMSLHADGSVAMRLNCNRATGTWQAQAGPDGTSGQFTFGPLAATRALCPPPSMDERVTSQAAYVRGYLLKDGRLSLTLMADGGIFVWEPVAGAAPGRVTDLPQS